MCKATGADDTTVAPFKATRLIAAKVLYRLFGGLCRRPAYEGGCKQDRERDFNVAHRYPSRS